MGNTEAILIVVVVPISFWLFMIAVEYLLISYPLKGKSPEEAVKVMQRRAFKKYRDMTTTDYAKWVVTNHNKASFKIFRIAVWLLFIIASIFLIQDAVRRHEWMFLAVIAWICVLSSAGIMFSRRMGTAPLKACTSYLEAMERDDGLVH